MKEVKDRVLERLNITEKKQNLNLDTAKKMASAAEKKARDIGIPVIFSVVDEGGSLILLHRMDESLLASIDIYRDGYPELGFIQQSFLFTLYLLQRHGDRWRPHTFYADSFLQAFPRILEEVEPTSYSTPEETVTSCYTLRMLENYLCFLGLAEIEETSKVRYPYQFKIRKRPLLDAVVTFNV